MKSSLPIPFALGVEVWRVAGGAFEETRTICPDCGGTRVVTLRLFDGTEHTLDCEGCSSGGRPPRGTVVEKIVHFGPRPFTPTKVLDVRGDDVSYTDGEGSSVIAVYARDMFETAAECAAACVARAETARREREEMATAQLAARKQKTAWSVHYWRKKVRDLRLDLERAEARLARVAAEPKT